MNSPMIEIFEGHSIYINDGMWDATSMCKKYGVKIADFLKTKETKNFIESLKKRHGLEDSQIIQVVRGKGKNQGTWVHQKLALKLAAWLNSDFEVWVFDVIEKLLVEGEVKLKNEINDLKAALSDSEAMVEVKELQKSEARAESKYWREELTLYREGHHPDYEQVGTYKPNFD